MIEARGASGGTTQGAGKVSLYLVVHPRGSPQRWKNTWLDDDLLEEIQTSMEIGQLCEKARLAGELVFVHRCRDGEKPASICCAVRVAEVTRLKSGYRQVKFTEPTRLDCSPPSRPGKGQSYYHAPPVA